MNDIKQVIILRKDLNMRKGKMVAQGAHASMAVLLNAGEVITAPADSRFVLEFDTNSALHLWMTGSFKKVTCGCNSEAELIELYEKAKAAGLLCSLIQDSGLTEFNGVKTYTAVAIGPDYAENVDPLTGELKLL